MLLVQKKCTIQQLGHFPLFDNRLIMYLYSYCMTISFFFFFSQCFVKDAPKEKVFLWNIFLTSWFSQLSSRGWIKFWLHSSSVWSMQKKIEYTFLSLSLSLSLSLYLSLSFPFLFFLTPSLRPLFLPLFVYVFHIFISNEIWII